MPNKIVLGNIVMSMFLLYLRESTGTSCNIFNTFVVFYSALMCWNKIDVLKHLTLMLHRKHRVRPLYSNNNSPLWHFLWSDVIRQKTLCLHKSISLGILPKYPVFKKLPISACNQGKQLDKAKSSHIFLIALVNIDILHARNSLFNLINLLDLLSWNQMMIFYAA